MEQIKKHPKYYVTKEGLIFSSYTNRFLKFSYDKQGYERVRLYIAGLKAKTIKVHRLVAETYIDNPENKKDVNHIDGNKANNNVNNLEWCTRSENVIHAFRMGLSKISENQKKRFIEMSKNQTGANSPASRKLINIKTGEIFNTIKEVLPLVNLKRTTFQAMLNGQNTNRTDFKYYEQRKRKSE